MPWNGSSHNWALCLLDEGREDDVDAVEEDEAVDGWDVVDDEDPAGDTEEVRRPLGRGRRLRSV